MFGLTPSHRYFLYCGVADMRKGFDGLCGLVLAEMAEDPRDGSVYIYMNRRHDRMKLLVWDQTGFTLYYKRLERGTFEVPRLSAAKGKIQIDWQTLMLLITGIRLSSIRRRERYGGA